MMCRSLVRRRRMPPAKFAERLMSFFGAWTLLRLDIPTNPQDIVTFGDEGFTLNMNNMEQMTPYFVRFCYNPCWCHMRPPF